MTAERDLLSTTAAGPRAVRGGMLRVLGYLGGSLMSIAGAALLFRHLGVDDTGRYGLVLSILAIAAGLTDFGMTAIGVRELSVRVGPARRTFAQHLLGLRISATFVGAIVGVAFAAAAGYAPVVIAGVALGGVGLVLTAVQSTYSVSLQSRLRLGWITVADVLRQFVGLLMIAVLVVLGASLLPFFAIPIVAGIVVIAVTITKVRRDIPLTASFDRREWGAMLRDIVPFSLATAAASLYFRVAIVIVSLLSTAEQLGYFTASFRVIEALSGVPPLLVGAAFPILARAARDDHQRLGYAVRRLFEVSLILGAWIALELAICSTLVISIIGGASFAPAADVLAIQGIGIGAMFVGTVWGTTLLSIGRHGDILRYYLVGLTAGTILVAVFASSGGAHGAAIGTAVAEVLIAVLSGVFLRRARRELFPPLGIVGPVALAILVAGVPALALDVPTVALAAGSTVLYAGVLAVFGAIPPELLADLRSKRSRSVE